MEMTIHLADTVARDSFDYCSTLFDNGTKYAVYYGGTQPLKPGPNGRLVGQVAVYRDNANEWYATADSGDAAGLRWTGGFGSRRAAAVFLVAQGMERHNPAVSVHKGQVTRLGTSPMRDRADQPGFLRMIPNEIRGVEIVHVGRFTPGGDGLLPHARVVCRGASVNPQDYSVHTLGFDDVRGSWSLENGTYDIADLEAARARAER